MVLEALAVRAGMGRPFAQLALAQRHAALELTLTGFAFGILSYGVPKLAAVAFLTRVLNPGRAHAVFLWALAAVCLAQLLAMAAVRIATTRLNDRGEYESPEANVVLGIYGGGAWNPTPPFPKHHALPAPSRRTGERDYRSRLTARRRGYSLFSRH